MVLVHGVRQASDDAPKMRFTEVYLSGSATLIHSQETRMAPGVADAQRRGSAPFCPPWSGRDPMGDDEAVLVALNENYVEAFRTCDLAWYDAHLAPDFVVINADGSFDDRSQALHEFAQPTYATKLLSFPVEKVVVRCWGDWALIQAENPYEMKDGRRGVNAYTDVWQKQPNGSWRCVAAHITPVKAKP